MRISKNCGVVLIATVFISIVNAEVHAQNLFQDGRLFVATNGPSVAVFEQDGTLVASLSLPVGTQAADVAFNYNRNLLYVTDRQGDGVLAVDSTGAVVQDFAPPSAPLQVNGIEVDQSGTAYVAAADGKVHVFNSDGTYDRAIVVPNQPFILFVALSPDESKLFVTESSYAVGLHHFDLADGDAYLGDYGQTKTNGLLINQIAFAPDGTLYTTDDAFANGDGAVERYFSDGTYGGVLYTGIVAGWGLEVGPSGDVWVGNTNDFSGDPKILRLDTSGNIIGQFGDPSVVGQTAGMAFYNADLRPPDSNTVFFEDFESITSEQGEVSSPFEREAGTFQASAVVPGWEQTGNLSQFLKVNGDSGNTALLLNEVGDDPNTISRTITGLTPGETYRLQFEHWGDNYGDFGYGIQWEIDGNVFSLTRESFIPLSGEYRVEVREFTASSSAVTLRISETSGVGGSPVIDNIVLEKVNPVVFFEDFEEVTSSGGSGRSVFEREAGSYSYYAIAPGWTQVGVTHQFIRFVGDSGNTTMLLNESGSLPNTLARTIDGLVPGAAYQLTFEHSGDNAGSYGYTFEWEINGEVHQVVQESFVLGSGDYRTVQHQFVATGSTTSIRFSETSTGLGSPVFDNILIERLTAPNDPPTADAGPDQAVRVGRTVILDGSGSFDDNTPTELLHYAWSILTGPLDSASDIQAADSASPSLYIDARGTYELALVVTDENGLSSEPDTVVVSSNNVAPSADAGPDQLVVVDTLVLLDGSNSSDPENDPINYFWEISMAPQGSVATLEGPSLAFPRLRPDIEGTYVLTLHVSDPIGIGNPDTVEIFAAAAEEVATIEIVDAGGEIATLEPAEVSSEGNQNAMTNFLMQATVAISEADTAEAILKLEQAISRVDGCALRGEPDGNGPGRDWITDCDAQLPVYDSLQAALEALLTG